MSFKEAAIPFLRGFLPVMSFGIPYFYMGVMYIKQNEQLEILRDIKNTIKYKHLK